MFWPEMRGRWIVRLLTWVWAGGYAAWCWMYGLWQALVAGWRSEMAWRRFYAEEQELRRLGR